MYTGAVWRVQAWGSCNRQSSEHACNSALRAHLSSGLSFACSVQSPAVLGQAPPLLPRVQRLTACCAGEADKAAKLADKALKGEAAKPHPPAVPGGSEGPAGADVAPPGPAQGARVKLPPGPRVILHAQEKSEHEKEVSL